jgi:hypothetical protein
VQVYNKTYIMRTILCIKENKTKFSLTICHGASRLRREIRKKLYGFLALPVYEIMASVTLSCRFYPGGRLDTHKKLGMP